eukprot:Selendium_serpulae@DN3686_c0_g1_i1.p1
MDAMCDEPPQSEENKNDDNIDNSENGKNKSTIDSHLLNSSTAIGSSEDPVSRVTYSTKEDTDEKWQSSLPAFEAQYQQWISMGFNVPSSLQTGSPSWPILRAKLADAPASLSPSRDRASPCSPPRSASPNSSPPRRDAETDPTDEQPAALPMMPSAVASIPAALRDVIRFLADGQRAPVGPLAVALFDTLRQLQPSATDCFDKAADCSNEEAAGQSGVTEEQLREAIPILCQRKALGAVTRPRDKKTGVPDDDTVDCLWVWESTSRLTIETLILAMPLSVKDEWKICREMRDKVSKRVKTLHKLVASVKDENIEACVKTHAALMKLEQKEFADLDKQRQLGERRKTIEAQRRQKDDEKKQKEEEKKQKEEEKKQKEEERKLKEEEKRQLKEVEK